jgi:hypothetical protein
VLTVNQEGLAIDLKVDLLVIILGARDIIILPSRKRFDRKGFGKGSDLDVFSTLRQ